MGGDTGGFRSQGLRLARRIATLSGACSWGCVEAAPVEQDAFEAYQQWLEGGYAAGMDYLAKYQELRRDPRLLMEDAEAAVIVTLAFSYAPERERDAGLPMISAYAYGKDYHDILRKRILEALRETDLRGRHLRRLYRICVDTAPVMERYWAVRSGMAQRCRNGMVSVPGAGPRVFLAEVIVASEALEDWDDLDKETRGVGIAEAEACLDCGACVRACPGGALADGKYGEMDARRCLSYLTIEHRGDWDTAEGREAMDTAAGRNTLYGCDRCVNACPLLAQENAALTLPEFAIGERLLNLDADEARKLSEEEWRKLTAGSAMRRVKFEGWKRNLSSNFEF